jgi:hypothetical protein
MIRVFAGAAALAFALPAAAFDYQVHGFAEQGYLHSEGNDVGGDSRGPGTFQIFDVGVNGAADFGHGLLLSGQEVVRRSGDADNARLDVDFAQLDYRWWRSTAGHAGVRIGKVKIPYGFYNDTRDVAFDRPGVMLPDSVYSDSSEQQRDFLFASEGGQVYGDYLWGANEVSLVGGWMLNQDIGQREKQTLITLGGLPFDLRVTRFWHARLMDDISHGRWQVAVSHLDLRFEVQTDPSSTTDVHSRSDVRTYPVSLRYNAEAFTVTLEYAPQHTQSWTTAAGTPSNSDQWSDGGYLQGEYRFMPDWTALLRVDSQFADRRDRNGSGCAALGQPDYACYAYTGTVGANWQPDEHWGVWAEANFIDGTLNKFTIMDNQGRTAAKHWSSLLVMAAYRF